MTLSPDQRERLILLDRAHGVQELLRGIAHDIRNNLQVVALASQLGDASRTPDIDARVEEAIEAMNRGLELLGSMGNRLSDAPPAGRLGDLVELLTRAADYQRNLPPVPVRFAPAPECVVAMPPWAAMQVLLNLIANAKEASPSGQVVEVGFRLAPPVVEIGVEDRGAGLDPGAGEPFGSSKDSSSHAGTGLHAARSLAARFGGSIGWGPRTGGGTTVRVSLPIGA